MLGISRFYTANGIQESDTYWAVQTVLMESHGYSWRAYLYSMLGGIYRLTNQKIESAVSRQFQIRTTDKYDTAGDQIMEYT